MVFNELPFLIFLAVVVAVYYLLPLLLRYGFPALFAPFDALNGRFPHLLRNGFLLAASCYFYIQTVPVFAVYMTASIVFTYSLSLLIGATKKLRVEAALPPAAPATTRVFRNGVFVDVVPEPEPAPEPQEQRVDAMGPRGKKAVFIIAIILNIGLLFVFKYADFFSGMFNSVVGVFGGVFSLPILKLAAPLGISFYVFQSTGYVIDVYRKKVAPERNPITYAAFISFFPQISSGPIGRADQLLPQFRQAHPLNYKNLLYGGQRFIWGLFKKVVLANWLGIIVDTIYSDISSYSGLTLIGAAVMYGLFIYIDFSAYTDMALGTAKALGFTLVENFKAPYFATNMSGFWRRWHASLTSWLTDYIFTPLVWSRWANKLAFGKKWEDRAPHFAANILIVFLISGLWHGANYNFIIWGSLHGLFRVGEELFHKIRRPGKIKNKYALAAINPFKRIVVFVLATFAHIFFYFGDETPSYTLGVIKKMIAPLSWTALMDTVRAIVSTYVVSDANYVNIMFYVLGFALLLLAVCDYFVIYRAKKTRDNPCNVLQHLPFLLRWPCYIFIIAAIIAYGYFGTSEFVYFQF